MRNNRVRAILRFVRLLLLATALCITVAATAQIRTIETTAATLHLSELTGDLVGMRWKDPNLEVIGEPRLGENFRLLVPNIGYQAAYFNSRDQHVSRFETIPDGVICIYDSLQNDRESISIKVRYQIRALNEQVLFSIEVENSTARTIAEVMYGIVGGQQGIANRLDTESVVPGENSNLAPHLSPVSRRWLRRWQPGHTLRCQRVLIPRKHDHGVDERVQPQSEGWILLCQSGSGITFVSALP